MPLRYTAVGSIRPRWNSVCIPASAWGPGVSPTWKRCSGRRAAGKLPLGADHPRGLGNLNSHCKKSLTDYHGKEQADAMWSRLRIHATAIHGSWLHQAEIELSLYSRQCLGTRRIPDLETLQRETRSWKDRVNREQVKINWEFDRTAARKKFGYRKNSFRQSMTWADLEKTALVGRRRSRRRQTGRQALCS